MRSVQRRTVLASGLLAALAGVCPEGEARAARTRSTSEPYTLSPHDSLDLYVRIVGNTAGGRTYLQYDCDVSQVGDRIVARPLYRVRGIARTDWTKLGEGSYSAVSHDHGVVCDLETGQVIDRYVDPVIGRTTLPIHYRSGPFRRCLARTDEKGKAFYVPWQSAGGGVWFTETVAGKKPNRLQPEVWGRASAGADIYLATRSTYLAELELVEDRTRTSVPATHQWTYLAPYEPWLLMGEGAGFALWQWVGRKVSDRRHLDPYLVEEITRRRPNFFDDGEPWHDFMNGAIQYMSERKP